MKFCAVERHHMVETSRSKPLPFEQALEKAKALNRANQDTTWNAERRFVSYVEEAPSVKHLPVTIL